jgi:formamidopyrimidine-DNA glycosylase
MPELPEVETTRLGIEPHISQKRLSRVIIQSAKLRYPVPEERLNALVGEKLLLVERRAKYLLLTFSQLTLIIHLGMSGSLRITSPDSAWRKHDHWQLDFGSITLRYHDPRRFGFLIATESNPKDHPFLSKLGPEPLSDQFSVDYLWNQLNKRKTPIKVSLMNNEIVVGIGNIYACESLFLAKIHPLKPSNQLSMHETLRLHQQIKTILIRAIEQGGSTLRDFLKPNGQPGYFAQTLNVYGRALEACYQCDNPIDRIQLGGRSSYFCPHCQTLNSGDNS